jgi:threonine dehydratase
MELKTKIVGVVADDAPAYAISFQKKQAVAAAANSRLADGLSCRTPVAEALEIIFANTDHMVQVSEDEIAAGMRSYYEDTHNVAEGAAGAGLAAVLKERDALRGKRVGVVFTGGNVDREVFLKVLHGT